MNSLVGTTSLIRLILRRDRMILPLWIVLLAGFIVGTAASFANAYPTSALREQFASSVASNPAVAALLGPLQDTSVGGLTAWRIGTAGGLAFAVIGVLTVVRHTRSEEKSGRSELVRSAVVGRRAPLIAALVVTNFGFVLVTALGVAGLAGQGLSLTGSAALGLSLAGIGWVFAALAAVAAQLMESDRRVNSAVTVVIAVCILLRIVGDAGNLGNAGSPKDAGNTATESGPTAWLGWLSPMGWVERVLPFSNTRWWVLGLAIATAAVLWVVAFLLAGRRDLGAGLWWTRTGPARAAESLRGPWSLVWRLQRGQLVAFTVASAVFGFLLGAAATGAAHAGPQLDPFLARVGVASPSEALVVLLMYALAEVVAAYPIVAVLRARSEEISGRTYPLLSTPMTRTSWVGAYLGIATLGPVVLLGALGLAAGLGYGLVTGDIAGHLPRIVAGALGKVPAIWVLGSVAVALFGLVPRHAAAASWTAYALVLLVELAWETGQVSDAAFAMSPFSYVYPLEGQVNGSALLGLTVVAAVFSAIGVTALCRRDLG